MEFGEQFYPKCILYAAAGGVSRRRLSQSALGENVALYGGHRKSLSKANVSDSQWFSMRVMRARCVFVYLCGQ